MRLGFALLTFQHHPDDPRSDTKIYRAGIELGVAAEAAGFDSVWTSEHHFVDDGYLPAQLPVLAAIGARTSRIRLGTGVLLAPMFDPLHLAADAAVVDVMSAGRLILGLGLGWRDEEFEGWSIPRRERVGRLEGVVTVLRQAWSDGPTTGDGRHYRYPRLNVTPKPATTAGPPIWIGAGAEPAVRRAVRIADGYFGSGASVKAMAERVGWITDEAARIGRDPATFSLGLHRMTFAWRDGDAWSRVREAAHYMNWKYEDMGQARGSLERRRPPALTTEGEEALRRRVIVGTPEEVAAEIRAYEELVGPDGTFGFRSYFPGLDPAVQQEAFDVIAEDVLPLLR